jgi:hypothetical protein
MFGLSFWLKVGAAIAFVAALYAAWYAVDHWHNAAWEAEHRLSEARQVVIVRLEGEARAAVAENLRVKLAWAADSVDAQKEAIKVKHENEATFTVLTNRARSLAGSRTVVVSGDTVGLFSDVADAANASHPAAAAAGSEARTDPVPAPPTSGAVAIDERDLRAFLVDAGMAYTDAVNQFHGCVKLYEKFARSGLPQ